MSDGSIHLLEMAMSAEIEWKGPVEEVDTLGWTGRLHTRETMDGLVTEVRSIHRLERYQWQVRNGFGQVLGGSPFGDEQGLPEEGWDKVEAWLRLHAVLNEE